MNSSKLRVVELTGDEEELTTEFKVGPVQLVSMN